MTSGMETRAPWTAPQDQTRGSRSSREPGIGGDAARVLELGADFAIVGRSAILHHDFPKRVAADPHFKPVALPVTREYLASEGLSPRFVIYMQNWKGFVAEEPAAA